MRSLRYLNGGTPSPFPAEPEHSYTGSSANMLTFPADVFPKNLVGSVYGLAKMGSGFGGMLFSLITGWVIDHYSYVPVFIGFGITPPICVLVMWTLLGPLRR